MILVLRSIDRVGKDLRSAPAMRWLRMRGRHWISLKDGPKTRTVFNQDSLNTNPELSVAFRRGVGVSDASAGSACASDVTPEEGYDP